MGNNAEKKMSFFGAKSEQEVNDSHTNNTKQVAQVAQDNSINKHDIQRLI